MHGFSQASRPLAVTAAMTAAFACTMGVTAGSALAARRPPPWCKALGTLSARLMPQQIKIADCDLRGRAVRGNNGLIAIVPSDGTSVVAHTMGTNGGNELRIEVDDRRGEISIYTRGRRAPQARPRAAQGPMNPCSDGAYRLEPSRWPRGATIDWRYYPGSSGLTGADIRQGVSNMVNARTNCAGQGRFTPPPNVGQNYAGLSSRPPNLTNGAACGRRDGGNTFGWLSMTGTGGNVLAATCIWFRGQTTVESDMALQELGKKWWTGGSCSSGSYSVEAVATHEAGHVLGLSHIGGADHSALTMAPSLASCDNGPATLGKGDYNGLIALYGGR